MTFLGNIQVKMFFYVKEFVTQEGGDILEIAIWETLKYNGQ